jgi:hypothetical protein
MATSAEYSIAAAAVMKIVMADINQDVPAMFRNQIPTSLVAQFATDAAKAAVDAVDADRANTAKGLS